MWWYSRVRGTSSARRARLPSGARSASSRMAARVGSAIALSVATSSMTRTARMGRRGSNRLNSREVNESVGGAGRGRPVRFERRKSRSRRKPRPGGSPDLHGRSRIRGPRARRRGGRLEPRSPGSDRPAPARLYRGPVDGVQEPKTVRAVRAFQRRHGLTVDGLAGPRTRAAWARTGDPLRHPDLRRGMRGCDAACCSSCSGGTAFGQAPSTWRLAEDRRGSAPVPAARRPDAGRSRRPSHRTPVVLARDVRLARDPPAGKGEEAHASHRTRRDAHRDLPPLRSQRQGDRAPPVDPRRYIIAGARIRSGAPARRPADRVVYRAPAIDHWSRVYGVDPRLVRALAWWESGFNNALVSPAGARHAGDARNVGVRRDRAGREADPTHDERQRSGRGRLPRPVAARVPRKRALALAAYVQGRIPSGAVAPSARPGSTSPACSR